MPFEAASLIGYKWPIESSEVRECTVESIPGGSRRCARASLRAHHMPVRASPPLSVLTAVRCPFYSSRALIFEVEKGPEQKSSRRYASMTCCGAAALDPDVAHDQGTQQPAPPPPQPENWEDWPQRLKQVRYHRPLA